MTALFMGGAILPGGTQPWHRIDDSKSHHYSQKQIKRCLHDRNPLLPILEDKYASRSVVEEKNVCELPQLFYWSESGVIDWNQVPERCVIKTNHWSGDVLFLMDNGPSPMLDVERKFRIFSKQDNRYRIIRNSRDQHGRWWPKWRIQRAVNWCLRQPFPVALEWGATQISPRGVMVEELLLENNTLPNDWKVHVFHGKAGFIQYDVGRMSSHSQSIYNLEGQRIHQTSPRWSEEFTPSEIVSILGHEGISSLVSVAEKLAEDIDYTRVDLYRVNEKWVFGEFTNYHNSCHPQSIEWEELGGSLWS